MDSRPTVTRGSVSWIVRLSGIGRTLLSRWNSSNGSCRYLYKIRKPELVRAVDRNRKRILERIS